MLRLEVDNGRPHVAVDRIVRANGDIVQACDFVRLQADEQVGVVVTAVEPRRGHLHSWSAGAEYGESGRHPLGGEGYPTAPRPSGRRWEGVRGTTLPFTPPTTCAYLFRVSAEMRVTNGYAPSIGGANAFKTLTLVRP